MAASEVTPFFAPNICACGARLVPTGVTDVWSSEDSTAVECDLGGDHIPVGEIPAGEHNETREQALARVQRDVATGRASEIMQFILEFAQEHTTDTDLRHLLDAASDRIENGE